ncbi:MAG: hypothetical protein E6J20_11330 [Chloroflexi bacterium]|nr:MAG: hypothetical protein E6J20_11330 [Chloroflexota bacterium]
MQLRIYTLTIAAFAALMLWPLNAAAATPSPSPALDSVLAKPPGSDFAELTTGQLHGKFTSHDWATSNGTSGTSAAETEATLNRDGFLDGYGKTWASSSAGHAMVEAVMAFKGGAGAKKALTALEASDKADPSYKHADTVSGIDPYYGAHFAESSSNTVGDLFVFAKGNDIFFVILASAKDDVLTLAAQQAKTQYEAAPASTIPSSQWPENAVSNTASSFPVAALGIAIAFIVVVVALVAFLALRRRGPAPMMAGAVAATPDMSGGAGSWAAGAAGMPGSNIQMSPDGNYWWDGQGWKDAAQEAPPTAQRSSDGTLWWDGRTWRPVPQAGQPPETKPSAEWPQPPSS